MQAPPPYEQPRKSNAGRNVLIILLVVVVPCLVMVGLATWFGFRTFTGAMNQMGPTVNCAVAYQRVQLAILDYAKDHEGTLPPAATWQADVAEYYAKQTDLQSTEEMPEWIPMKFEKMDPNAPWGCKLTDTETTALVYNADVAGKKIADLTNPGSTVLIFEAPVEPAMNLAMPFKEQPADERPVMIMGEKRDWIKAYVEGEVDFDTSTGSVGTAP